MKYHKMSGYIACVNGIFHTYAVLMMDQSYQDDLTLLFKGQINISGTCLMVVISLLVLSSFASLRRVAFEFFHFVHIVLAIAILIFAFYHSGIVVPVCASIIWGGDLILRRIVMPCFWYPRRANIKSLSDDVIELSFPKTNFYYNPGQYVNIAIPELSIFQWHPFSISSSPFQDTVTVNIKKLGKWSGRLCALAKEKNEVACWLEGPYGSLAINLGGNRYEIVVLVGGGIGVTAMQSVALQLEREYNEGSRSMQILYFVWTTKKYDMIEGIQISNRILTKRRKRKESYLEGKDNVTFSTSPEQNFMSSVGSGEGEAQSLGGDSHRPRGNSKEEVLGLDIFITNGSNANNEDFDEIDIHQGRPDLRQIFTTIKQESLKRRKKRVAVCVCGNPTLMNSVRRVCQILSDDQMSYDVHWTSF
jgi:NADPH oxidase